MSHLMDLPLVHSYRGRNFIVKFGWQNLTIRFQQQPKSLLKVKSRDWEKLLLNWRGLGTITNRLRLKQLGPPKTGLISNNREPDFRNNRSDYSS